MKSITTELLKIENLTVRESTTRFRGNNVGCNQCLPVANKNDVVWRFDKNATFYFAFDKTPRIMSMICGVAICQWHHACYFIKGKLNPGTIKLSQRRIFQRPFKLQARVSSLFSRDVYQTSVSAFSDAKIGPDV